MERGFSYRTLSDEEKSKLQELLSQIDSKNSLAGHLDALTCAMIFAHSIADRAITITMEGYRDALHVYEEISKRVIPKDE